MFGPLLAHRVAGDDREGRYRRVTGPTLRIREGSGAARRSVLQSRRVSQILPIGGRSGLRHYMGTANE
jgi:hypothetical protein